LVEALKQVRKTIGIIREKEVFNKPEHLKRNKQDLILFGERARSTTLRPLKDLVRDNPGPLTEFWNLDKG
jgi:hypothetical protein